MFFFPILPKSRQSRKVAKKLYAEIVNRAREPVFYKDLMVPDSFTGRFEMVALHTGLLITRLQDDGETGARLAQSLFDEMFLNMDIACRQTGIGDLGVPKQIKKMMKALQGRALIYDQAAKDGKPVLADALKKNLYATVESPPENITAVMSQYVIACIHELGRLSLEDYLGGKINFASLPQLNGECNGKNSQAA